MTPACVLYALAVSLHPAVCMVSSPLLSFKLSRLGTPQPDTINGEGRGGGEDRRTGSRPVFDGAQHKTWSPLKDVLPVQAALLPTAPSSKVIPRSTVARLLPSSTPTAIPTPSVVRQVIARVEDDAASSIVTETPLLRTQLRRGTPGNATVTPRLTTTVRETTTVYVDPKDCTGTPTPTAAMARDSIPISDAGQKGGIAGGTVGAVLLVAVLTMFCYRRVRRKTNNSKELMNLSDSGSTTDDAERGMVAHGGLFGSDGKTASAAESFATVAPQVSDPSVVTTTSQQVPIMFRPSRRLISRLSSLPVTPRASTRLSDLLNPVIRETVLLPRPLRLAGKAALGRSQSWQAVPHKQPGPAEQGEDGRRRAGRKSGSGTGTGTGSRSRSRSMTATNNSNSMYSTEETFDFAEYVTLGARTSRGTGTGTGTATQRASGTTDASGLRSTLAHFPRPPPYTFSRGDGRGLGTSWRESFVFSTPDDEVMLAFPELARQFEEDPPEVRRS